MATSGLIFVKTQEDLIGVYLHYDAYDMLEICQKNYNSQELAESLVALGDLSVLGDTIETCVAYHRDRGESLSQMKGYDPTWFRGFDYVVLFNKGQWQSAKRSDILAAW